jgi:hypothetical protein
LNGVGTLGNASAAYDRARFREHISSTDKVSSRIEC